MSGSRVFDSGVGTAIEIASASASAVLIGRRLEDAAPNERGDLGCRNVLNVRLARHEERAYPLADVVADDVETRFREFHGQR